VAAVGNAGGAAGANFKVVPFLRATPTTGPAGGKATSVLAGFAANEEPEVRWHGTATEYQVLRSATASALGGGRTAITVPVAAPGGSSERCVSAGRFRSPRLP
jgi:hypothetical protein